jgi:4-hydroxythreonine-4-phosphate dehydrogenase
MRGALPRLLLTAGEPAGIGPDLLIALARRDWPASLVAVTDPELLQARAEQLGLPLRLLPAELDVPARRHRAGTLRVHKVPLSAPVIAGKLDVRNAGHVLATLDAAAALCEGGAADAMVTAPVQKSVINDAGEHFTGHTEYLAEATGAALPVMLLVAPDAQPRPLRVALATTHLALRDVSNAINAPLITQILEILDRELRQRFGIRSPRILVAGLNPHAGESGHLGNEEDEVITPAIQTARARGVNAEGPFPADTLFTPPMLARADAVLAMYHDQGLTVLKHVGFGSAVNVTLGLPIIRTSVDHGTALDLAGTGRAESGSFAAAVNMAIEMAARTRTKSA